MTTPVHARPIAERIDWLMELSRAHSASFCSPENHLARQRYLAEHNTQIIAMKCMDLPFFDRFGRGLHHVGEFRPEPEPEFIRFAPIYSTSNVQEKTFIPIVQKPWQVALARPISAMFFPLPLVS